MKIQFKHPGGRWRNCTGAFWTQIPRLGKKAVERSIRLAKRYPAKGEEKTEYRIVP